jgi:hypothetical protein
MRNVAKVMDGMMALMCALSSSRTRRMRDEGEGARDHADLRQAQYFNVVNGRSSGAVLYSRGSF